MPKTVGVAVSNATFHFDKLYTYAVMPDQQDAVRLGSMVLVPFGRGSRARMGVVLACDEEPESSKLKFLFDVAPASACLTPELLRLVHFLKERTFCTYYEAVKAVIPYGAQYKPAVAADGVTPVLQKQLTRHTENSYKLAGTLPAKPKPTAKQLAAVALLGGGERTQTELEEKGISRAVLDNLCAKGVLECSKVNKSIDLYSSIPLKNEPIRLTAEQQAAYEALLPHLEDAAPHAALLYGVTGSGKTAVYVALIQKALDEGRSAMLLVPEIALTPQLLGRMTAHFGKTVAVLHSSLRVGERYDEWRRIARGEARVVVGTRSAVFAPLQSPGLLILDEEQEHTYKSENAPRYHAREIALYRGAKAGALVLFGSATPSIETMYLAKTGVYTLYTLKTRYNGRALPAARLIDMKQELRAGNDLDLSRELEEGVRDAILDGKQSILFLNRRGNSRFLVCMDCGDVPQCPRCSVHLTYHSAGRRLMCHYCGYSEPAHARCAKCGGAMKAVGSGTQKVEQELKALFPDTAVLRMDADTVAASGGHEAMLRRFRDEQIPILLGTQMVAKGLDFPSVTLVGVLDADMSLYVDNFRAAETTFSLITQVVGRSGRGADSGCAMIQTMTPEHPVLQLAARQDYDAFYDMELQMRKLRSCPPFSDLFTITVAGLEERGLIQASVRLRDALAANLQREPYCREPAQLLGPAPAPVARVNYSYRYQLTLVCRNTAPIRRLLAFVLAEFSKDRQNRGLTALIDINSYN